VCAMQLLHLALHAINKGEGSIKVAVWLDRLHWNDINSIKMPRLCVLATLCVFPSHFYTP
jgi:hypothetical protein